MSKVRELGDSGRGVGIWFARSCVDVEPQTGQRLDGVLGPGSSAVSRAAVVGRPSRAHHVRIRDSYSCFKRCARFEESLTPKFLVIGVQLHAAIEPVPLGRQDASKELQRGRHL